MKTIKVKVDDYCNDLKGIVRRAGIDAYWGGVDFYGDWEFCISSTTPVNAKNLADIIVQELKKDEYTAKVRALKPFRNVHIEYTSYDVVVRGCVAKKYMLCR